MAQHDTAAPPGGMTYSFGQKVEYCARVMTTNGYEWCPAVVICPTELSERIGVAYYSKHDGHQWTDHARLEDVRPVPDQDLLQQATVSSLQATIDSVTNQLLEVQAQLDRYRELFANMKIPASDVPGWVRTAVRQIQLLVREARTCPGVDIALMHMTGIEWITTVILEEEPSLPRSGFHPDQPF